MTKPAILEAIDAALVENHPEGVIAGANEAALHEAATHLGAYFGAHGGLYQSVSIRRSLAPLPNGWMVKVRPGFEKEGWEMQPRDPETGRWVAG